MNYRYFFVLITLATAAYFAADVVQFYPQLPEKVASHFGSNGQANGWSDKDSFLIVWGGILLVLNLLFGVIILFLDKMPIRWINVPNKEYWFAPERVESTVKMLGKTLVLLTAATDLFLILLFHLVLKANLLPRPVLGAEFWMIFGIYFIGMIGVSLYTLTYFGRLPGDEQNTRWPKTGRS